MHGIQIIEVRQHFSGIWVISNSITVPILESWVLHLEVDPRAARGLFRNGEADS